MFGIESRHGLERADFVGACVLREGHSLASSIAICPSPRELNRRHVSAAWHVLSGGQEGRMRTEKKKKKASGRRAGGPSSSFELSPAQPCVAFFSTALSVLAATYDFSASS